MDRFVPVPYPQGLMFPDSDSSDEESNPEEHPIPPEELPDSGDVEEDESLLEAVGGVSGHTVPQDSLTYSSSGVRYSRYGDQENPHHGGGEDECLESSALLPVVVHQPTPGNRGGFVSPNIFLHRLIDGASDSGSDTESDISRECVCVLGTVFGAVSSGATCGGLCCGVGLSIGTPTSATVGWIFGSIVTTVGSIAGAFTVYKYDQLRREVELERRREVLEHKRGGRTKRARGGTKEGKEQTFYS